jgi:hypothetical protein
MAGWAAAGWAAAGYAMAGWAAAGYAMAGGLASGLVAGLAVGGPAWRGLARTVMADQPCWQAALGQPGGRRLMIAAVLAMLASAQLAAATLTVRQTDSAGWPVRGSMRWCIGRPAADLLILEKLGIGAEPAAREVDGSELGAGDRAGLPERGLIGDDEDGGGAEHLEGRGGRHGCAGSDPWCRLRPEAGRWAPEVAPLLLPPAQ